MDWRILLTSDPNDLPRVDGPAFAVAAKGWCAPAWLPVVDVEDILTEPRRYFTGESVTMVTFGLSRLLTPSNRVRMGQALLRPWPGLQRLSVDSLLFVAEPWRMWWHFFAVGAEHWNYADSYAAEAKWNFAMETRGDDPFAIDRVREAMAGIVRVESSAFRFGPIAIEERPVSADVREEYAAEKEAAFADEKTIAAILRRLTAVAQRACPERSIPTASRLYERPPRRIVHTDLAVDRFLVGQLLERVELTNAIAEVGR